MSTSSAAAFQGLCGTLIAATTLTTALRLYSRRANKASLGPDDWTVIPAWFFFLGMNIAILIGVGRLQIGAPLKVKAASGVPAVFTRELFLAMDAMAALSEGFARISALLFFRRIFCVSQRLMWLRHTVHVSIGIIALWIIAFICLPLLQCGSDITIINSLDKTVISKYCGQGGTNYVLGYTISNVIMETLIIALPIPLVVRLQTTVKRRLGVLFVFATALVSLAAGCARLAIAVNAGNGKHTAEQADTMNNQLSFFWIFGAGMALIAINLPSLVWLGKKAQPEKILSGLRSALSLRSLSQKSRESRERSNKDNNSEHYAKHQSRDSSSPPSTTKSKNDATGMHQTYPFGEENTSSAHDVENQVPPLPNAH